MVIESFILIISQFSWKWNNKLAAHVTTVAQLRVYTITDIKKDTICKAMFDIVHEIGEMLFAFCTIKTKTQPWERNKESL